MEYKAIVQGIKYIYMFKPGQFLVEKPRFIINVDNMTSFLKNINTVSCIFWIYTYLGLGGKICRKDQQGLGDSLLDHHPAKKEPNRDKTDLCI